MDELFDGCIIIGFVVFIVVVILGLGYLYSSILPPRTYTTAEPWPYASECVEIRNHDVASVAPGVYCIKNVGIK